VDGRGDRAAQEGPAAGSMADRRIGGLAPRATQPLGGGDRDLGRGGGDDLGLESETRSDSRSITEVAQDVASVARFFADKYFSRSELHYTFFSGFTSPNQGLSDQYISHNNQLDMGIGNGERR